MNEIKREGLWTKRFNAEGRARYYHAMKDRLQTTVRNLSIIVAVLSCGPLANFIWAFGVGDLFSGLTGLAAGGVGIYLAISGLPTQLATATRAAAAWSSHSNRLNDLWIRSESGEDVWDELTRLDREMEYIDAAVIEQLSIDDELLDDAWSRTADVLG